MNLNRGIVVRIFRGTLAILTFVATGGAASAATFTVNNTNDSGPGSLRQAVLDANAASGPDLVDATGVAGTVSLTSGEIEVTEELTINGPGPDVLVVSGGLFRIFDATTVPLTIAAIKLTNGNAGSGDGGCIYASGSLTLNEVAVTECQAFGNGGGMYVGGNLTMTGGKLSLNHAGADFATGNGGGAYVAGDAELTSVVVRFNDGLFTGNGGGVYAVGGLIASQSVFMANNGIVGGGLYVLGNMTVSASLFRSNFAGNMGLALYGAADITLINSTIYDHDGNQDTTDSAVSSGGDAATVSVYHVTFNDNQTAIAIEGAGSSLVVRNSILWGDQVEVDALAGTNFDIANSLLTNASGTGTSDGANGNILGHDPLFIFPLAPYGGPTELLALYESSPAIDAGGPGLLPAPAFDQRGIGFPRLVGAATDMGAFELQASATLAVNSLGDAGDGVCDTAECTLREAIDTASGTPVSDTVSFVSGLSGTISLTSGALEGAWGLTINGPGAEALIVDADGTSRVLQLYSSTSRDTITLRGMTFTDGYATQTGGAIHSAAESLVLENMVITDSSTDQQGGGVAAFGGLALENSVISNNTAQSGGGGVYALESFTCANSEISNNDSEGYGGGFQALGGARLDGCLVSYNTVVYTDDPYVGGGGGLASPLIATDTVFVGNAAPTGGGLYSAALELYGCTVKDNQALNNSGAIEVTGLGSMLIEDSLIDNNTTGGVGGVINMGGGETAVIRRSTLSNNSAGYGGAIVFLQAGSLEIVDSLLVGNTATGTAASSDNGGGAILWYDSGPLIITNSTLSGNQTMTHGGALLLVGDNEPVTLLHNTITGNSAAIAGGGLYGVMASPALGNTIVANNNAPTGNDVHLSSGTIIASYSLIEDPGNSGIANDVNGNIVGTDPLLFALADNGGNTWTHAVGSDSPAWNAGDPLFATPPGPAFDQRGAAYPRVADGTIDIGAFENHGPLDGDIIFADGFEE